MTLRISNDGLAPGQFLFCAMIALITPAIVLIGSMSACYALTLSGDRWQIRFSSGMPAHPIEESGGSWSFTFPAKGAGEVDYVTRPYSKAIEKGRTLAMTFDVAASADAIWNHRTESSNVCSRPPASVRFILQKRGDDLRTANGRFWSNPGSVRLANGRYTLSVRLTEDHWTNVDGQRSDSGFSTLLRNLGNIGVTFGGGCFFGHGVNMERGTAKFIMRSFEIQ
jgi:hypothetical protein